MPTAIVTGSGGLIGSETVRTLTREGFDVIGVDNDMRASFFGAEASTERTTTELKDTLDTFRHVALDIRDREGIDRLFQEVASSLELIVHTAAQPSHDWAARDVHTDFSVNALGTLNLLQSTRDHKPDATFVFTSTNKVYGDTPNYLPLVETDLRLELPEDHKWWGGVTTDMSIDHTTHSLFGVSKAAADLAVQEYGRYFDIPTVCFRGGCLTGPQHAGAELHGFLSYLVKCAVTGNHYTVFGYDGKQVRDNIHSFDVVQAFLAFHRNPKASAVYNLGGGRESNISMREAILKCEQLTGRPMNVSFGGDARVGDHRWWISDLSAFQADYPEWGLTKSMDDVLGEIHEAAVAVTGA
ncbi:MAG: SDR family NAD(P)-dependent oxidoreductase [Patulibacter minatonensis]